MNFKTVDEILDFAIEKEEEAHDFYIKLAGKMENPVMAQVFKDFALEELGHKEKLLEIKSGKRLIAEEKKVLDLRIADYIVTEVEVKEDMDYQDALILAMKKEKSAFMMYNALAYKTDDENLRKIFLSMAQEEAKHKLRFEIEYDEMVLTEN